MKRLLLSVVTIISFNNLIFSQCAPSPGAVGDGMGVINPVTCVFQQIGSNASGGIGSGSFRTFTGFGQNIDYQLYININGAAINCASGIWRDAANNDIGGWFPISLNPALPSNTQSPANAERLHIQTTRDGINWVPNSALLNYRFANPGGTATATPSTVCLGNNVSFSVSNPSGNITNYDWSGPAGFTSTAPTTARLMNDVAFSGTYTVTLSHSVNTCTAQTSVNVIVNPTPTVSITAAGPTSFCPGSNVVLNSTATGASTYQWNLNGNPIAGQVNPSLTASDAGVYTLIATSSNGCTTTSNSITLTNVSPPAVVNPSGNVNLCAGSTITLNVNSDPSYSYQWRLNGNDIPGATNSSFIADQAGEYTVVVSTSPTCATTSSITNVTVTSLPTATIQSSNSQVCSTSPTTLTATPNQNVTYQWYFNGTLIPGATNAQYTTTSVGQYFAVLVNDLGCVNQTSTINVTGFEAPPITLSGSSSICAGSSVTLNASNLPGFTYQWFYNGVPLNGANASTYNANLPGNYYVQITNTDGCLANSSIVAVSLAPDPNPVITYNTPLTFCEKDFVILFSSIGGGYTYQWFKDGTQISGAVNNTFQAIESGNYSVEVITDLGCVGVSDFVTVNVIDILPPPVITQSNDTLFSSSPSGNQWYLNGNAIIGSTNNFHKVLQSGSYSVLVNNGPCPSELSTPFQFNISVEEIEEGISLKIYPNPNSGNFWVEFDVENSLDVSQLEMYNLSGMKVYSQQVIVNQGFNNLNFQVQNLPEGLYIVSLQMKDKVIISKLVISY